MIDLNAVANEVFVIIRSFDYEVEKMFDAEGSQVYEPETARRFFVRPRNFLVSITDEGENSTIRLFLSQSTDITEVLGLDQKLRQCATKFNCLFNVRKYAKELRPKDMGQPAVAESLGDDMMNFTLTENMYGTSKSSYLKLENARMIVRHSAAVAEEVSGARSRHIDRIFVENAVGERFLMPTRHTGPARAMAQHLNHQGAFTDTIGQQISRMAQDFQNLGVCAQFVQSNGQTLPPEAMEIREACRATRSGMRRTFERVYRAYDNNVAKLEEQANQPLDEGFEEAKGTEMARLKEMLVSDRKELHDDVFETVAKMLCDRARTVTEDDQPEIDDTLGSDTEIGVLGNKVNRTAWDDFKAGKIDFSSTPAPAKEGDLAQRLSDVTGCVSDESLQSLLTDVASRLVQGDADAIVQKVAKHAVDVAIASVEESLAVQTAPIVEFFNWVDSHSDKRLLAEWGGHGATDTQLRSADRAFDDIEMDFDLGEFLDRYGDDFDWGYNDIAPEDRVYPRDYILSSLRDYLGRLGDDHGIDATSLADRLFPRVAGALADAGYTLTEEALSRADVIHPKSPVGSLKAEVMSPNAQDPDYISRMRTLAGMPIRNRPQP